MYDDDSGYDLTDPKHPTHYERYADHADLARKRAKENVGGVPVEDIDAALAWRMHAPPEVPVLVIDAAGTSKGVLTCDEAGDLIRVADEEGACPSCGTAEAPELEVRADTVYGRCPECDHTAEIPRAAP